MSEMGAVGDATVLSVEACPAITPKPSERYRVVTGKFVHSSAEVIDLFVEGLDEPIGTTGSHPFWSVERHTFVPAELLEPNEHVQTAGPCCYLLPYCSCLFESVGSFGKLVLFFSRRVKLGDLLFFC
ncbi:MAG: hypothetical protein KDA87_18420 [Planctomycetales bacterium]|nr:hypothetical protein [Planctomycetales bacterium]